MEEIAEKHKEVIYREPSIMAESIPPLPLPSLPLSVPKENETEYISTEIRASDSENSKSLQPALEGKEFLEKIKYLRSSFTTVSNPDVFPSSLSLTDSDPSKISRCADELKESSMSGLGISESNVQDSHHNPTSGVQDTTGKKDSDVFRLSLSVNREKEILLGGGTGPLQSNRIDLSTPRNENNNHSIPTAISHANSDVTATDPIVLGSLLFHETAPNYKRDKVCGIIGKSDNYHQQVLVGYMSCFDFKDISLPEAFRQLCLNLYLTGETQAIDRILYQMSLRYWISNPSCQALYKSADIVYGTLFSIVLLNTDLHTVNIGARLNKRMNLKDFTENTLSLVDTMVKTPTNFQMWFGEGGNAAVKAWRKDYIALVKTIYTSVLEKAIIQNNPTKAAENSPSVSPTPTKEPPRRMNSSSAFTSSLSPFFSMRKGDAAASGHNLATGSFTNISPQKPDTHQIVIEGVLIRKHLVADEGERAANRRWIKGWFSIRISKENGAELVHHKLRVSDKEFIDSEMHSPVIYSDTTIVYPLTTATTTPIIPPSPGSFSKYIPTSFGSSSTSPSFNLPQQDKPSQHILSVGKKYIPTATNIPINTHPVFSSPNHDYKLTPSHESEPTSLIHSFFLTYASDPLSSSSARAHCFALHLANNHVYLFQAPTMAAFQAWRASVNYWSAVKSREPMRGGVSNIDYGWGFLSNNKNISGGAENDTRSRESSKALSKLSKIGSLPDVLGDHAVQEDEVSVNSGKSVQSVKKAILLVHLSDKDKSKNSAAPSFDDISRHSTHSGVIAAQRSATSFDKTRLKSLKFGKWNPEIISTRLVSQKDEMEQLASMHRQLELVGQELHAHDALRPKLQHFLLGHPQAQLALSNWIRKSDALQKEVAKYGVYVEILTNTIGVEEILIPASKDPLPEKEKERTPIEREPSLFYYRP